jgi:hypothetical protein
MADFMIGTWKFATSDDKFADYAKEVGEFDNWIASN